MSSVSATNYARRIERDLLEVLSSPFEGVVVYLKSGSILSWVLKVTSQSGQLAGCSFYFELEFPTSYPRLPPSLRCLTELPHLCVVGRFGGTVCLEILNNPGTERYEGWSPAFSAYSVLSQMQSFFDDEWLTFRGPQDIQRCIQQLRAFEVNDLIKMNLEELAYRRVCYVVPYDVPLPVQVQ